MESSWPENLPFHRRMAIGELVRGREIANRLKLVLSRHDQSLSNGKTDLPVDDLVVEILNTFTNSLSMLNRANSDEVGLDSGRKSEDSGESSKSVTTVKDRRGCYKRSCRKTSHTWTRDSSDLRDDGHAWRKYGQKVILNAKFPRNYFRCTHKYEQNCQATKQVQKIEENPPIFRTTYNGNHTCDNSLRSNSHHNLIMAESPYDDANDSSNLISFNTNNTNNNNVVNHVQLETNNYVFTSSSSSSLKRKHTDINDSINIQSSSTDYLSTIDHADVHSGANSVFSCTTSNDQSFDLDEIVNSVTAHFHDDDALQFAF